jgi:hypothetical protein
MTTTMEKHADDDVLDGGVEPLKKGHYCRGASQADIVSIEIFVLNVASQCIALHCIRSATLRCPTERLD